MSATKPSATQSSQASTDYSGLQALPEIWPIAAHRFGNVVALRHTYSKPNAVLTYAEMNQNFQQFASGLLQTKVAWPQAWLMWCAALRLTHQN